MTDTRATASSNPSPQPGRVLVVDDQRNMRITTALVLCTEGYQVFEAATGQEALDILTTGEVDVLLTDLKMEPMDGLTLMRKALEVAPRLQVVIITAFGSIDSAVEAMRMGAYDYLSKPFKDGVLRHRVELALERARLLAKVDLFTDESDPPRKRKAPAGTRSPKKRTKKRAGRPGKRSISRPR